MTTFERDEQEILKGCDIEVLKRRKAELASLMKQLKCEKNGFKRTCIAQEINRKENEYRKLDALV